MFAVETNRTVSLVKGRWQQVQDLDIPDNGLEVFLKDFDKVMLFRTMLKDQRRHYVVYLPEAVPFERNDFSKIHDQHWQIEQYHRAINRFAILNTSRCAVNSLSEITFLQQF